MLCIEVREVILNVQPQHVMVELCTDRRQRLQAERLDESCSILPGAFGGTKWWIIAEGLIHVFVQTRTDWKRRRWNYMTIASASFSVLVVLFIVYLGYKIWVLLCCIRIEYNTFQIGYRIYIHFFMCCLFVSLLDIYFGKRPLGLGGLQSLVQCSLLLLNDLYWWLWKMPWAWANISLDKQR